MKFPHYRYVDMVIATHRLLTEHLGIAHLRLVLGTSMGGMQAWMWGEMYPDFMDGLVPIASQPIAISGRNWMYRRIGIEAIRNDPDWNGGNYDKNPTHYVYSAPIAALMTESAMHYQKVAPSRAAMDELYARMVEAGEEARRQQPALRHRGGDGLRPVARISTRSRPSCSPSISPTTRSTRPSSAWSSRRSGGFPARASC